MATYSRTRMATIDLARRHTPVSSPVRSSKSRSVASPTWVARISSGNSLPKSPRNSSSSRNHLKKSGSSTSSLRNGSSSSSSYNSLRKVSSSSSSSSLRKVGSSSSLLQNESWSPKRSQRSLRRKIQEPRNLRLIGMKPPSETEGATTSPGCDGIFRR